MSTTDRYTFIIPAPRVEDARAVLGSGSFQCPLYNLPGTHITHYACGVAPGQFTQAQLDELLALPGMKSYGPHLTKNQAFNYVGARQLDPELPER